MKPVEMEPRAFWVPLVLAIVCAVSTLGAQAKTPAPQAAAETDSFKFNSDAAIMMWIVKGDQTEPFESIWGVIRGRLEASTKPELKTLGENLKVFKADMPPSAEGVTYFVIANPASKTTSYSVAPFLLYESGLFQRAEADELFKLLQTTIVRISIFPMNTVK